MIWESSEDATCSSDGFRSLNGRSVLAMDDWKE